MYNVTNTMSEYGCLNQTAIFVAVLPKTVQGIRSWSYEKGILRAVIPSKVLS